MIRVVRYTTKDHDAWNRFNSEAKNPLFMFDRNYMDYHSDRFKDYSLMIYDEDKLIALLPMNEKENVLYSHGGLTYGGFITDNNMKQHTMLECVRALKEYARLQGIKKIVYKAIPHIYHLQPAEEDQFALFYHGAKLSTVDSSTFIDLQNPIKMPKGRKAQISRAKREGIVTEEKTLLDDFKTFIDMENEILTSKHGIKAAHTADELFLLKNRFPDNIHLYAAMRNDEMLAGVVVYEYTNVIHTQYMASNEEGRTLGGLDLIVSSVMEQYKDSKKWLDFGISSEHGRIYLNEGLSAQKEGFGGRTGVYYIWEIDL